MTVSNQNVFNAYLGNGVQNTFFYTFRVLAAADIEVYVDGSLKTLDIHYSVTGVGSVTGGSVIFLAGHVPGAVAVILHRNAAITQPIDYTSNDSFPAETHELGLDRATLRLQEMRDALGRAPVLKPVYRFGKAFPMEMPDADSLVTSEGGSKVLRWNATGTNLDLVELVTETGLVGDVIPSSTVAGLPAAGTPGKLRRITDKQRGVRIDNGSRWVHVAAPTLNALELVTGGAGTAADPYTGWSTAMAAVEPDTRFMFPPGFYRFDSPVAVKPGWQIEGSGWGDNSLTGGTFFLVNDGEVGFSLDDTALYPARNVFRNFFVTTFNASGGARATALIYMHNAAHVVFDHLWLQFADVLLHANRCLELSFHAVENYAWDTDGWLFDGEFVNAWTAHDCYWENAVAATGAALHLVHAATGTVLNGVFEGSGPDAPYGIILDGCSLLKFIACFMEFHTANNVLATGARSINISFENTHFHTLSVPTRLFVNFGEALSGGLKHEGISVQGCVGGVPDNSVTFADMSECDSYTFLDNFMESGTTAQYLDSTTGRNVIHVDAAEPLEIRGYSGLNLFDANQSIRRSAANEISVTAANSAGVIKLVTGTDASVFGGGEVSLKDGVLLITTGDEVQLSSILRVGGANGIAIYPENGGDVMQLGELTSDASAAPANMARLYARDNGAGKTQLVVRFASGGVQVLATEP